MKRLSLFRWVDSKSGVTMLSRDQNIFCPESERIHFNKLDKGTISFSNTLERKDDVCSNVVSLRKEASKRKHESMVEKSLDLYVDLDIEGDEEKQNMTSAFSVSVDGGFFESSSSSSLPFLLSVPFSPSKSQWAETTEILHKSEKIPQDETLKCNENKGNRQCDVEVYENSDDVDNRKSDDEGNRNSYDERQRKSVSEYFTHFDYGCNRKQDDEGARNSDAETEKSGDKEDGNTDNACRRKSDDQDNEKHDTKGSRNFDEIDARNSDNLGSIELHEERIRKLDDCCNGDNGEKKNKKTNEYENQKSDAKADGNSDVGVTGKACDEVFTDNENKGKRKYGDKIFSGNGKLRFFLDTTEVRNKKLLKVGSSETRKLQRPRIISPCPSGDCQVMVASIENLFYAMKYKKHDKKLSILWHFIRTHQYGNETIKGFQVENGAVQFVLLNFPSGLSVNGIEDREVPSWNRLKPNLITEGLTVANEIVCDSGWVVTVHTAAQSLDIMRGAFFSGLDLWRSFTLVSDKPIYRELKEPKAKIYTLIISMFHRKGVQRPKPYYMQAGELNHHQCSLSRDLLFETIDASKWHYKADGTPWRGGAERAPDIWQFLVLAFTRYSDSVIDLTAGTGGFIRVASALGRHSLGIEADGVIVHDLLGTFCTDNL